MLLAITSEGKVGLGVVAGLFILFAIVVSFVIPRRNPDFPGRRLGLFVVLTILLFLATITAVVVFAKEEEGAHGAEATETHGEADPGATTPEEEPTETSAETTAAGDAAAGEAVFASAGCGGCHTLEAAGSSGNVGPNLDEAQPDAELVEERVHNGAGAMPSFRGQLDEKQIQDVAAYVVESTQG